MKNKGLKIILYILIVILISLVSFMGIYKRDTNRFSNIVNDYLLGSSLKGAAVLELKVDDTENEVIYDENGNIVEEVDEKNEDKYTTVNEPVNKEEVLNLDNYEKSKKIIEERLNFIEVPDYNIRLNHSDGTIIIEADETYLSDISTMVSIIGKIDARDSESDELLFDNSNIKNVRASYQTDSLGYTTVYLDISFNNDSKYKIDEIKNKYTTSVDESDESENNENETTNEVTEETEEEETTEDTKTINLNFDDTLLNEVEFSDIIISGSTLSMPVSDSSTNSSTINSYYNTAILVAESINIGQIPVVYETEATEYFAVNYENIMYYIIIGLVALFVIIYVYTIIKYKFKGIIAMISHIAWIAILLLIIRYTNVYLSISSILSLFVLMIINAYITNVILNTSQEYKEYAEILKNSYIKLIDMLLVVIIIFIVFSFTTFELISSVGLLMFWGVITVILNSLVTAKILSSK